MAETQGKGEPSVGGEVFDDTPVQKEKKPRTEAQRQAWEKAQRIRIERAQAKKDTKVAEYVEKKISALKQKLPIQESQSETDEEEEPEVVVVRLPPKQKPKPKKQMRVEVLAEESFDEEDEDPTPITKPKVKPRPRAEPVVQKQSPVAPKLYFV